MQTVNLMEDAARKSGGCAGCDGKFYDADEGVGAGAEEDVMERVALLKKGRTRLRNFPVNLIVCSQNGTLKMLLQVKHAGLYK